MNRSLTSCAGGFLALINADIRMFAACFLQEMGKRALLPNVAGIASNISALTSAQLSGQMKLGSVQIVLVKMISTQPRFRLHQPRQQSRQLQSLAVVYTRVPELAEFPSMVTTITGCRLVDGTRSKILAYHTELQV
jgi:hypothetical protein